MRYKISEPDKEELIEKELVYEKLDDDYWEALEKIKEAT